MRSIGRHLSWSRGETADAVARVAAQTALLLIIGKFGIVLICNLGFLVGVVLTPLTARLAIGASVVLAITVSYRVDRERVVAALICAGVIVLLAIIGTRVAVDQTADGGYHGRAIAALVRGWNPVWTSFATFSPQDLALNFIDTYGKASWIVSAALESAGAPAGAEKCASLYLPAAALLAVFAVARRLGASGLAALVIAAACACNPVSIQEFWLRMNDGQMTALVTIFAAGALLWIVRRDKLGLWLALPAMAVAMNMKLSGVPVFVLLCASVVAADLCVAGWRRMLPTAGMFLATGLFAMTIIGASPYVRGPVVYGALLAAPTSDADWARMMEGDWPAGFEHMSAPERWVRSFTSFTDYDQARPRTTLAVSVTEFQIIGDVEVMIAGLGPWFSVATAIASIVALWAAVTSARAPRVPLRNALAIMTIGMAAASMLMPQSWYFRYVPHLWLVPIGLALSAAIGSRTRAFAAGGVLLLLLANSSLVLLSALVETDVVSEGLLWRIGGLLT